MGSRAAMTQKVADWAFVPQNKISFVNVTSVNKPNSFFVQMIKFQHMLLNLMDELGTLQQQPFCKLTTKVPTKPGSFVVAKFSEKFYRAKVEKTLEEGQFLLLFVDFGFYAEVHLQDMLALPTSLLMKLPFQAIECSLHGVLPSNTTEWPESARDRLISMSRSDDGQMIPFVIEVVDQTRSQVTGGWCYMVHLLDIHLYTWVAASLVLYGEARWKRSSDAQLEKRLAAVKDTAQQFLSSDEPSSDSSSSSTLAPEQPPFQGIPWPRLDCPLQSEGKSQQGLRPKLPDNSSDCDGDSRNCDSAKWQEKNNLGDGCISKQPHEVVLAGVSDPVDENLDLKIVPTETFEPYDPLP